MADIIKKDMSFLWADQGDVVPPSNAKITEGWAVEAVPRQWWNWMQNRVDSNVAYMLQKGIPEWDATTEYIAGKSYVQRVNVLYVAITTNTGQDPALQPTHWKKALVESSSSLEAIKSLTPSADTLPYFTSGSAANTTTITSFARTILDDTNAAAVRATISAQQQNTALSALSGTTPAANQLPYYTGSSAASTTSLTSFARSLLDDTNAGTARGTLGLGSIATQNSSTVSITGGTISGITDLAIADGGTGASNATAARSNLGLGTAATANLTTSTTDGTVGRVLKVGDGGWMGQGENHPTAYGYPSSTGDVTQQTKAFRSGVVDNGVSPHSSGIHFAAGSTWGRLRTAHGTPDAWVQGGNSATGTGWTSQVVLSDNLLQGTGSSTTFPMSQAATSTALNTKANTSTQVIAGDGLSGGGNLTANRTMQVDSTVARLGTGGGQVRTNTQNDARFLQSAALGTMASQDQGTGDTQFRTNSQNNSRFALQSGTYSGLRAQATTAADVGAVPTSGGTISGHVTISGGNSLYINSSGTGGRLFHNGTHQYWDNHTGNWLFRSNTTTRFTFASNGAFTATNNVTAYSDARIKKDLEVIPNALEKVQALAGYTYTRTDLEDEPRQAGVIAQEVMEVLPEVVIGGPTEEDPDGRYSVAYGNMVGLLIEAVKELKAEVDALKAEVGE